MCVNKWHSCIGKAKSYALANQVMNIRCLYKEKALSLKWSMK